MTADPDDGLWHPAPGRRCLSVPYVMLRVMARHTTFKFCLDPTVEQEAVLSRHAGAARFAFNQCLRIVKTALTDRRADPDTTVPWTGFDLIDTVNAWKRTEAAGRVFTVDTAGDIELYVTGLSWRTEVCQQVFEEAAVDLGKGLKAWSDSRTGKRRGKRVGFPRFKKKTTSVLSLRVRNKHAKGGRASIRVGDGDRPRSLTLPGIGQIAVHDDTRRLRRMLAQGRATILFATVTERAGRWWVSLNIEAADLHPAYQHPPRDAVDNGDWVGVDRGLSAFAVAATTSGAEIARIADAPKALAAGMSKQRRLAKSLSRKQKGSHNRRDAAARLGRHHRRVANVRRQFTHPVCNQLVKTHDRLVIENLHVAGMLGNHRLARAISDAGWAEFARQLHYKQSWCGGQVIEADRWYPSSQLCSVCGDRRTDLSLAERVFTCANGHRLDRDLNAAINLARWGQTHHDSHRSPDPQAGGRVTNARRQDGSDQHLRVGETSLNDAGTNVHTPPAA